MKLSEQRQQALYNAMAGPIMVLRVELAGGRAPDAGDLDARLWRLEQDIWNRQAAVLADGWRAERERGDG